LTEKQVLDIVSSKMSHRPKIVEMFRNCYNDTLENTIKYGADGTVFMLTGDIPAMWLRDSTNQLRPYLITASENEHVSKIIEGVMKKQLLCILRDPYANAFNECENGAGHHDDETDMLPDVWERKYEIDSLCYPLQLAYLYWKNTGRTHHFDGLFLQALQKIIALWRTEQNHNENSPYYFRRYGCPPQDTLSGNPVAKTGMTWSGFRPSDDGCVYGYLVPSNMFAVTVLRYAEEIVDAFYNEPALKEEMIGLRNDIEAGINKYGTSTDPDFGEIYIYEADGLGNIYQMDDANVPSLLSMPYFGYCGIDDEKYQNTRKWVLSRKNPYYFEGSAASGIGSPHTGEDKIWHIALAIQGITAADEAEKELLLDYFEKTDAGTGFVHEGFDKDDPYNYTREWFSWANAMFAEFVLSACGLLIKM